MSTKNLARTVIEGGRRGFNKFERRNSTREERAAEREMLTVVRQDPEAYDAIATPARRPVRPEFSDKLNPAYEFLDSRVGKSWNKTRAMISEKFDIRTTAGRHVVNDHLLKQVREYGVETGWWGGRHSWFVDKQGILRKPKVTKRPKGRYVNPDSCNTVQVAEWLGSAKIGSRGANLYWFVLANKRAKVRAEWPMGRYGQTSGLTYVDLDADGKPVIETGLESPKPLWRAARMVSQVRVSKEHYRQSRKLTKAEAAYVLAQPEWAQNQIFRWADPGVIP